MGTVKTQKSKGKDVADSARQKDGKAMVLVVDDHPIFCQGLSDFLNRQPDLICCGVCLSLAEALKSIAAQHPQLVLLDLRLGGADGLDAIKSLHAQYPDSRLLIISQFDETLYAERALRAGASGYVMKERACDEVLRAIRTVLGGSIYVSTEVSMMAVKKILTAKPSSQGSSLGALSDRELHVFKAVGSGKTNKEIAAELKLSVKTVETYREHIKYKLGLASGAELTLLARRAAEADSIGGASL